MKIQSSAFQFHELKRRHRQRLTENKKSVLVVKLTSKDFNINLTFYKEKPVILKANPSTFKHKQNIPIKFEQECQQNPTQKAIILYSLCSNKFYSKACSSMLNSD